MEEAVYWTRMLGRPMSRRGVLRGGSMVGAGLAGAALIGCGEESAAPPAGTPGPGAPAATPAATAEPETGPRQGGTLGMPNGIPQDNFNPVVQAGEANGLSAWHVYDRPISSRLEAPGYVLEAAESVEVPDDLTVIFHLKEGLVYQDRPPVNGRAVSTEDIAILHEYVREEPRASDPNLQKNVIDSMETPDDRTITFHLQQPDAYIFSAGSGFGKPHNNGIIPQELVLGDFDRMEPVGSGPYQLKSYQFGVLYEYERNPTYRRASEGMPYIDTRVRLPLTDATALEAAFRGEQLHVWVPPAETADRLERDLGERLEVTEFTGLNLFMWNMSARQDWSHDIRTREGFYRGFDAEEHIELATNGWAVRCTGKMAQGLDGYLLDDSESAEYLRHDPAESRQLLEASGFDFDRVYTLTTLSGAVNEQSLQVHQEQWRRIDVQTSLDVRPASEWLPNVSTTGNYDLAGGLGFPAYDTPQRPLRFHHSVSGSPNNFMTLFDPNIDAMIEESERTLELGANQELVKEIQRELLRNYSNLSMILTRVEREIRYDYVRDWEFNNTATVMYRPEAWLDL